MRILKTDVNYVLTRKLFQRSPFQKHRIRSYFETFA